MGRFGTAAEQQPTLPLGLGCFGDLIFVPFKSNIRGNISTRHMGKQWHLGKEMVGKQLWCTQRRRISRCFGDFSCTFQAIWMLFRALARLQFIELCPTGTDLIIVSIFGGVQCIFEIWLPTTYDMFFRFLFQMFKGFRLELDFVKSFWNPDCMVVTSWVVFVWAAFRSELRQLRYKSATKTMVEGDGCHRIAAEHRKSLVGRKLKAKSPNGRFKAGAQAIMKCGGVLTKIEVHGKNMFYFFGKGSKMVVVHVHFGLAGAKLWELNEGVLQSSFPIC